MQALQRCLRENQVHCFIASEIGISMILPHRHRPNIDSTILDDIQVFTAIQKQFAFLMRPKIAHTINESHIYFVHNS